MNELQLSYPEDIVVREVITELFHFGILTPKDYVRFMKYTTSATIPACEVFDRLKDYLEELEKEEK
jgi:hypothetical protein